MASPTAIYLASVWEQTEATVRLVVSYFNWIWVHTRFGNTAAERAGERLHPLELERLDYLSHTLRFALPRNKPHFLMQSASGAWVCVRNLRPHRCLPRGNHGNSEWGKPPQVGAASLY
ncbi:MAG: hypothetical protein F6K55_05670 [Moorea sp. SIO4A3]|nr:hypothetical protein [Moorena sp. SIO4A3]